MEIEGDLVGHGVDNRDEVLGREGARASRSQMLGRRQEEKETLDTYGVALVEGR